VIDRCRSVSEAPARGCVTRRVPPIAGTLHRLALDKSLPTSEVLGRIRDHFRSCEGGVEWVENARRGTLGRRCWVG
jgi:hypothetical protein